MGILTSWNLDTPKGLKSRLLVGIRRIRAEFPHSTELELGKLHRLEQIPTELPRSIYSEVPQQARKSSNPQNRPLSLLYKE
jgi:hypothetical protein